jgi:hypothetical protein
VNPGCGGDWPGWSCSWAPPPTGFGQYWDPHACTYDGCIGAITSYGNYHFTYTICAGWFCYQADQADIDQRADIDQYGAEVEYNYGPWAARRGEMVMTAPSASHRRLRPRPERGRDGFPSIHDQWSSDIRGSIHAGGAR